MPPLALRFEPDLWIRTLLAGLTLLALVLVLRRAAAQETPQTPVIVLLDVARASEQQAARLETLRIHLSDVAARLVVESVEASATSQRLRAALTRGRALGAAAVLFIEEQGAAELRVYWVEPKQGQVWMRRLALGSDSAAAGAEKAALVARGGVEELLQAGRLSSAPAVSVPLDEPAAAVAPPPAVAPSAGPPPRFGFGLGYVGTSFAEEAPWQHAAQLFFSVRVWQPFYVAGRAAWAPSVELEHAAGAAELIRYPAELVLGYRAPRAVALRAEAGLFADYLQRATTRVSSGQAPTPSSTRVLLGASAKLGLDVRLAGPVRLAALFGLQAPFNHFNYLAADSRDSTVAVHLRRLRPVLDVGLVAEAW